MGFRKDFYWGAATSSYQIEGGAFEDGKGLNIWDVFSREEGRIAGGCTGDEACDHYHRFRQDVALMKELGIKAYRFSLNWARILPNGTGKVNESGIRFYSDLIDTLLEAGIEPFVTLYHWELPYELYKKGGWMNRDMVRWFGDYAALAAERFSDRVKYFFTINEPQCFIGLGFLQGIHAPGLKAPVRDTLLMAHHVLMAHGEAVRQLREHARQDLQIGYAPTGSMSYPASERAEDIEAARSHLFGIPDSLRDWTWNVSWWSDPVFFGEYPEEGMRKLHAYLPEISREDMGLIAQPLDMYGQNIYNGNRIRMGEDGKPQIVPREQGAPRTAIDWPVTPECLYWGPKFLCERYHTPLYITENGVACSDAVSLDGKVHDPGRIDFMERYLGALRRCAEDGTDVRGYFYWSLMDNLEWNRGYDPRFGLVYVDYATQERIIKDSGYWYKTMIRLS